MLNCKRILGMELDNLPEMISKDIRIILATLKIEREKGRLSNLI